MPYHARAPKHRCFEHSQCSCIFLRRLLVPVNFLCCTRPPIRDDEPVAVRPAENRSGVAGRARLVRATPLGGDGVHAVLERTPSAIEASASAANRLELSLLKVAHESGDIRDTPLAAHFTSRAPLANGAFILQRDGSAYGSLRPLPSTDEDQALYRVALLPNMHAREFVKVAEKIPTLGVSRFVNVTSERTAKYVDEAGPIGLVHSKQVQFADGSHGFFSWNRLADEA